MENAEQKFKKKKMDRNRTGDNIYDRTVGNWLLFSFSCFFFLQKEKTNKMHHYHLNRRNNVMVGSR